MNIKHTAGLIVTDVSCIKQENNAIRLYVSGNLEATNRTYEFDLPYTTKLKEALDKWKYMEGTLNKSTFQVESIKGYQEEVFLENEKCPFCNSALVKKDHLIEDNNLYCYNASCQNDSILKLMNLFDTINIDVSLEDIIYILGMFNQYLSPKIDLISIIGNLRERQIFNDTAKSLLNRIDFFIYSMGAIDLLKILHIHDNALEETDLKDMSMRVLINKILSCQYPNGPRIRFICFVVQSNLPYINKLLNYQELLRSDSLYT